MENMCTTATWWKAHMLFTTIAKQLERIDQLSCQINGKLLV